MTSSAKRREHPDVPPRFNPFADDPPPKTPYEVASEHRLFRLRHYEPAHRTPGRLPVVFAYSLFKRPYILDLIEQRSIVRSFLDRNFAVYMIDWHPPKASDAQHGLEDYVYDGIARAIDDVREREETAQVSLVGICLGGLLSLLYTALAPDRVARLVQVAVGVERHRYIPPIMIEQMISFFGNLPAWWISGAINSRVPAAPQLPEFLAKEFDEPALADGSAAWKALYARMGQWLGSDVPLAGRLAREILCDIYWEGQLADGSLRIGGDRVELKRVNAPILNISGARDRLVPPQNTASLVDRVGSSYARNLVFPASHIGLLGAQAAHEDLWPRIGAWIKLFDAHATFSSLAP